MSSWHLDEITCASLRRLAELCRDEGLIVSAVEVDGLRLELAIPEVTVNGVDLEGDDAAS